MKENTTHPTILGVLNMKKTFLIAALAVALVLSFASAAFAVGPFYSTGYENSEFGSVIEGKYLDWDAAATFPGNTGTSPHGGYTASTNKCAVCHSVHTATVGGKVLTDKTVPFTSYANGCVYCHAVGNTFTNVVMTANADGYISPHGTCGRCHALNPHGVGTSDYPVLASKLINKVADTWIGQDLAANANGLTAAMFSGAGTAQETATGVILGTGYLCGNCHSQAFAVNVGGTDPVGGGTYSGHRVTAMNTTDWANVTYGVGAYSMAANGPIAYKDAFGCQKCHDAKDSSGGSAFPHGYVDAAGALSPKTVAGSSYIWLTTGADALATTTLLAGEEPETGAGNANLLTEDGLCLKCHRSGTGSGVGLTF